MAKNPPTTQTDKPLKSGPKSHWQQTFQLLLCFLIFLLVNRLSCQAHHTWDITNLGQATLSDTTHKVIASLEDPVHIFIAFNGRPPLQQEIHRIARHYADAGMINVELLDPVRNPARAREIGNLYSHAFQEDTVIVAQGERSLALDPHQFHLRETQPDGTTRKIAFRGEDMLTSAIYKVSGDDVATIYLITGKGSWPQSRGGNGSDTLQNILPRYNAQLRELSLDGINSIPDNAEALIIANPSYDFTGPEIAMLREFYDERKGGILFMLNPQYANPNLDAFLRSYGITPLHKTAMRTESGPGGNRKIFELPVQFMPGSELTDPFVNVDARFPGVSGALAVDVDRDDLRVRRIFPAELAQGDPRFWGESNPQNDFPQFTQGLDAAPPLVVAASVVRGQVDDSRLRIPAARMIIIANPHLLDPATLTQANSDFVFSSINWMLERAELMGIGPRQTTLYRIELTDHHSSLLNYFILGLFPCLVLIIGLLVWRSRRS